MFEKIDFSDLNKFIVSLGVVIFTLAFVIPWLFLKEILNFNIEQTKYNSLTESSKQLILQKEEKIQFLLKVGIPTTTVILSLSGIALIIYGIFRWNKKQKEIDDVIEKLKIEKLKKELQNVPESEKRELIKKELLNLQSKEVYFNIYRDENSKEVVLNANNEVDKSQVKQVSNETIERSQKKSPTVDESIVNKAIEIEKTIFQKVNESITPEYILKSNVKINNTYFDILLQSTIKAKSDIIIEVKYYSKLHNEQLYNSILWLKSTQLSYENLFRIVPRLCLIVVYDNENVTDETVEKMRRWSLSVREENRIKNTSIIFIGAHQLAGTNFSFIFDTN